MYCIWWNAKQSTLSCGPTPCMLDASHSICLLPRHLKFKMSIWNKSYLNKCIWLHFFRTSNNTGVLQNSPDKKYILTAKPFTCMLPALYLLFLDLGYLSQLFSGYDFYVFNYSNLSTPINNVQSDQDIMLYHSIKKVKAVVWTGLKHSRQLQRKVSIQSNWN